MVSPFLVFYDDIVGSLTAKIAKINIITSTPLCLRLSSFNHSYFLYRGTSSSSSSSSCSSLFLLFMDRLLLKGLENFRLSKWISYQNILLIIRSLHLKYRSKKLKPTNPFTVRSYHGMAGRHILLHHLSLGSMLSALRLSTTRIWCYILNVITFSPYLFSFYGFLWWMTVNTQHNKFHVNFW